MGETTERRDAASEARAAEALAAAGRRDEGEPSGDQAAAALNDFGKRRGAIEFDALRSAYYHADRRWALDLAGKLLTAVALIGGSGAVAAIGQDWRVIAITAGLAATIASALTLVFGFSLRAAEEALLARRCYEILADAGEAASDDDLKAARRRLTLFYGEERPPMRAVDAVAYNAASGTLLGDAGPRCAVTRRQSLLRHLLPFNDADFREEPRQSGK